MNGNTTNKKYWINMIMALGMLIFFLIFSVLMALMWAKSTDLEKGVTNQEIKKLSLPEIATAQSFKVMTWNISYAFGVGSEGTSGYHQLTRQEYDKRFHALLNVIKKEDPDILLLQEIDFDSKRTHHQDQALAIAQAAGYSYIAYAVSWDLNYVPFPDGLSRHFGKIRSGGAVLSRFKIVDNQVQLYEKPFENPFWYNWFYLFRYAQVVTLEINGEKHNIINAHLEAFNKQNRLDQIKQMVQLAGQSNQLLLMGGDYNTTPTVATKKHAFEDYPEDDYREDGAYQQLQNIPNMRDTISQEEYAADEALWFTFPSTSPERKLDYIFIADKLSVDSKQIIQTTASDHLPIVTTLQFNQL